MNDNNKNQSILVGVNSYSDTLLVMSPTISQFDHQEIVETTSSQERLNSSFSEDMDNLFSFEIDGNGMQSAFLDQGIEFCDLDWMDVLPESNLPVPLEEIDPSLQFLSGLSELDQVNNDIAGISHRPICTHRSSIIKDCSPVSTPDSYRVKLERGSSPLSTTFAFSNLNKSYYENEDSNSDLDALDLLESHGSNAINCKPFLNNEDIISGKPGQRVILSSEERRMFEKTGHPIPLKFPLTRLEERTLRMVRRKIRNKLSAQASRAKRQKYVQDLEHKYSVCNKENQRLRLRVTELEEEKKSLTSHLRKLRTYVTKLLNKKDELTPLPLFVSTPSKLVSPKLAAAKQTATAGGTSLLVVTFIFLLWSALVPYPQKSENPNSKYLDQSSASNLLSFFPGRSRNLLSSNPLTTSSTLSNPSADDIRKSNEPLELPYTLKSVEQINLGGERNDSQSLTSTHLPADKTFSTGEQTHYDDNRTDEYISNYAANPVALKFLERISQLHINDLEPKSLLI